MILFHRLPQGWEIFHPVQCGALRTTRLAKKYWYFRSNGVPSAPLEGDITVATPLFNTLDGDLFTVLCSACLPTLHIVQTAT